MRILLYSPAVIALTSAELEGVFQETPPTLVWVATTPERFHEVKIWTREPRVQRRFSWFEPVEPPRKPLYCPFPWPEEGWLSYPNPLLEDITEWEPYMRHWEWERILRIHEVSPLFVIYRFTGGPGPFEGYPWLLVKSPTVQEIHEAVRGVQQ